MCAIAEGEEDFEDFMSVLSEVKMEEDAHEVVITVQEMRENDE